jgi:4-hydroxythreonine-4-phosphate dehydrogenase
VSPRPRLALIPGDTAGVGPELCVRLAQQPLDATLVAFADGDALRRAAERLGLPLQLQSETDDLVHRPGTLALRHRAQVRVEQPGQLQRENAPALIAALREAADAALRGEFDGLVTGPLHKGIVNQAGIAYTGTTELLAEHAAVEVVMMLASDTMRVALATTHLPLRQVPDAISATGLERTLQILHAALKTDFGIAAPCVAVLGLNPHAGEDGHLGREEIEIVVPLLDRLRGQGMNLIGPLPADTAFLPNRLPGFDAVLAMYHDQGLPVLKHGGFERAVNITLGLPYIRVAVDHGTALDLAGRGEADAASLILAAQTAVSLSARRRASHSGSNKPA